jgi:hypothetical protein
MRKILNVKSEFYQKTCDKNVVRDKSFDKRKNVAKEGACLESERNNDKSIVPVALSHSGIIQGWQIWSMLKSLTFS